MWDIYPGSYRVILKPTSLLPADAHLALDNSDNRFTIVTPNSPKDSINAYSMIAVNAILRSEFTLANDNVSKIFAINSFAIPGWSVRHDYFKAMGDTTSAIAAIDSLLIVVNNELDTLITDSLNLPGVHNLWIQDMKWNFPFWKWWLEYPEESNYYSY